jgi:hypothetical protein
VRGTQDSNVSCQRHRLRTTPNQDGSKRQARRSASQRDLPGPSNGPQVGARLRRGQAWLGRIRSARNKRERQFLTSKIFVADERGSNRTKNFKFTIEVQFLYASNRYTRSASASGESAFAPAKIATIPVRTFAGAKGDKAAVEIIVRFFDPKCGKLSDDRNRKVSVIAHFI